MSFLKAIEKGKLAKKDKDLQEPKKIIAKKITSSKDENEQKVHAIYQAKIDELEEQIVELNNTLPNQEIEQYQSVITNLNAEIFSLKNYIDHSVISATSGAITQYENTIKQLETEKYNIGKNYNQDLLDKDKQIKELEEEIDNLHDKLNNQGEYILKLETTNSSLSDKLSFYCFHCKLFVGKGNAHENCSINSIIEVMQHDFDEALERIKDMTDLSLELEGKLNRSISPEQMADLRSSWNTEHFKEIAQLKKTIDNMNQDIITQLEMIDLLNSQIEQNNNKSPSEYVELLKNDQTKTELVKNLHDRMFKVKHKGKAKNYNSKYAIEIFRLGMEWRNLL